MRTSGLKLLALFVIAFSLSCTTEAQVYVTIRPAAPAFARPIPPSRKHTWIDGEWIWRNGRYQYTNGYWVVPSRFGAMWVPGHWKQKRRGWFWKPGHWRRR
ncbi:MAG: YXWGXW repeat-containing protein [Chitinophagaceae bacterium]|nr:YXWGXW repeat-containing protein [Chitinophagaceae bacterium]